MSTPNTHDIDSLTGATYFVVGRGTEGGPSPYRLAIAGVTSGNWGELDKVAANSGYSLGTIQVDLGQRGTWALGATDGAALKPGETTYVDGIIDQAAKYAKDHDLKFTSDTAKLRTDLLKKLTPAMLKAGVTMNTLRYRPEPLLSRTGTGSLSSASTAQRAKEDALSMALIKKLTKKPGANGKKRASKS